MKRCVTPIVLILLALAAGASERSDAERLIAFMKLQPGVTVAEIGAGDGALTVEMAKLLGRRSVVYSTELRKELPEVRKAVRASKLRNIIVVEAGLNRTNLPRRCCNAIFMRRVYHHFRNPEQNNRSLFESLRPNGLLAILDFQPKADWERPEGVHREGGHGVSRDDMIREVTAAGFELVKVEEDWPDDLYAVLFRKKV